VALKYHPKQGEIVICSYPKDMIVPEMVKTRPVVIISPKFKSRGNLATVVPLSTTRPPILMPYHYELCLTTPLPGRWSTNPCWVICDHPMTVNLARLDLIYCGKDVSGKRIYHQQVLPVDDIRNIQNALKAALALAH
jgi:mRNA interferase MazF